MGLPDTQGKMPSWFEIQSSLPGLYVGCPLWGCLLWQNCNCKVIPSCHTVCSDFFLGLCLWSVAVVSDSLRSHGLPHASLPCSSPTRQAFLSITNSWNLLILTSIKSLMLSNHLILKPPSSPFAFSLSQQQDLFQWISSSHQVAKVLELQDQHQSFQWIFSIDFL